MNKALEYLEKALVIHQKNGNIVGENEVKKSIAKISKKKKDCSVM